MNTLRNMLRHFLKEEQVWQIARDSCQESYEAKQDAMERKLRRRGCALIVNVEE